MISLNLNPNPNEYCGYALVFYFNSDSIITLNKISHNESLEIKFQSDIWKKTNEFFKKVFELYTSFANSLRVKEKYEDLIKSLSRDNCLSMNNYCRNYSLALLYEKNHSFGKNYLIDKELKDFFHGYKAKSGQFKDFINIKNKINFHFHFSLKGKFVQFHYKGFFIFEFPYQIATNKKELIDLLCNIKRKIEYEINVKGNKRLNRLTKFV